MAYERPHQAPAETTSAVFDAENHLTQWLGAWMRRHAQTRVPAPLPYRTEDAARWWLKHMYARPPADPTRWEDDPGAPAATAAWAVEARSALNGFLRLTAAQRHSVVRLVGDGIPYRGESMALYMSIVEETERMRDDPTGYRKRLRERLARYRPLMIKSQDLATRPCQDSTQERAP